MLPEFFEFYNPTKVVYKDGIATDLKPELDLIGIKKYGQQCLCNNPRNKTIYREICPICPNYNR